MERRLISIVLFCLYLGAVAVLCFAHGDQLPDLPSTWFGIPSDKVAHALMFMPFPILSYQAFRPKRAENIWKAVTLTIFTFTGAGVASATEKIQSMLAYRSYELQDLIADCIGLTAGAVICAAIIFINSKKAVK